MDVIDLVSGCGGLSFGFMKEGYTVKKAVEFDEKIANTYMMNHPEVDMIVDDIRNIYIPMGFTNFKIEGRSLGSALILEFILYYMTKPEFQIHVREAIYLDNMLDLF